MLALASLEVDISKLEPGNCMVVKWRGKPVFVRARTDEEIEQAANVSMGELRDPETDEDRVQKPETLVVLGVCTTSAASRSTAQATSTAGSAVHGSHYDTSGRIRKGPAPLNLEVPPYKFVETPSSSSVEPAGSGLPRCGAGGGRAASAAGRGASRVRSFCLSCNCVRVRACGPCGAAPRSSGRVDARPGAGEAILFSWARTGGIRPQRGPRPGAVVVRTPPSACA